MSSNSGGSPGDGSDSVFVIRNGCTRIVIDTSLYRVSAVQKTAYRLADRCTVVLEVPDGSRLPLSIAFPQNTNEAAARETLRLFFQELLDQELREKLGDETRAMRALLLAHAFSRTDLIRSDE